MNRRNFHFLSLAALGLPQLQLSAQQTTSLPKIKAGQIGTKHAHAEGQLETMIKSELFDVVGIVENDDAQWERVKNRPTYQQVKRLKLQELLNTPSLKAVSVETEVGDLLNTAEQVINAGMHLHMDKPAGESYPQFKRILGKAQNKKLHVKLGYMFRYNPAFQFLFKALKEGWLGEVYAIHAEMSKWLGEGERTPMLRYQGGSMFELGCHLIDALHLAMGRPDQVTPFIRKTEEDGFSDNMLAVFEYPKAVATIKSSFKEVQGGLRRQFVLSGSKGVVEIRPLEPASLFLTVDAPFLDFKKGRHEVKLESGPRYLADWTDFALAIHGEKTWPYSYEHDLEVQESVLRASKMSLL